MLDTPLCILQANVNRSVQATESLLEVGIQQKADVILVQEPWILNDKDKGYKDCRSIAHSAFTMQLPAHNNETRPRTLVYTSRFLGLQVTPQTLANNTLNSDIQVFVIEDLRGSRAHLINVYNEKDANGEWTLERSLYNIRLLPDVILAGDFNIRHPSWDYNSSDGSTRTTRFYDWIEDKGFLLQNTPGTGTFYRPHMTAPSVLDLTLMRGTFSQQETNWRTIDIGSDHLAISYTLPAASARLDTPEERQTFNTKKANWDLFSTTLLDRTPALEGVEDIEELAKAFSDLILSTATECIPRTKRSPHSKPWWKPELRTLRRSMARAWGTLHSIQDPAPGDKQAYLTARNTYFQAIKKAKRDHWNAFLENTDPKSIYKAMSYTKASTQGLVPAIEGHETFHGKCNALRQTLLPPPPLDAPLPARWAAYTPGDWQ
jgi:endonuclease/exonuclease/phosphatase family metal-dependent hydrolase